MRNLNDHHKFVALLTGFIMLSIFGIYQHELWLDEAHHWLLARDSNSISDLFINTRYEGHPILWNSILHLISKVTSNPLFMQIVHSGITFIAVGIFLKKAPFSWSFKALFIFGYFVFFEYNIVARNYALGMLFMFVAASLYCDSKKNVKVIAILLGLLCNTHAIFCIPAFFLMCLVIWDHLELKRNKKSVIIGGFIFVFGALLALYQIIPPGDNSFFDRQTEVGTLTKGARVIYPFFKGAFFIPNISTLNFWNTHLVFSISKVLGIVLSIFSLIIPYFLFKGNKRLLFYMYGGIIAMGCFIYLTDLTSTRYYGMLYLMLIVALWMQAESTRKPLPAFQFLTEENTKWMRQILIYAILMVHCISGIYAYSMDLFRPFTNAKQVALFLEKKQLDSLPIVTPACDGTAISAYAEKKVYFVRFEEYMSYCRWNQKQKITEQSNETILHSLKIFLQNEQEEFIFVAYRPIFKENNNGALNQKDLRITLLKKFETSIVSKGTHYVYYVTK